MSGEIPSAEGSMGKKISDWLVLDTYAHKSTPYFLDRREYHFLSFEIFNLVI
jgi:hypothetical protein